MSAEPATCAADLAAKVLVLTSIRFEEDSIYSADLLAECEALAGGRAVQ